MEITLYINHSEKNRLKKTLTDAVKLTGNLRNESNVVNPVITIYVDNPSLYNYCYIPDFKRYYFIKDITCARTGIWAVQLQSDPLMSYADEILKCSAILDETTAEGSNSYLNGRNWVANAKNTTSIIKFSSGLLDNGEFILITAGG